MTFPTIETWYGVFIKGSRVASFQDEEEARSWAETTPGLSVGDFSVQPEVQRTDRQVSGVLADAAPKFSPFLALVDADQLAALRANEQRLRAREDELLGRNTELVEALRTAHATVARLEAVRKEHCDAVDRWAERALSAERDAKELATAAIIQHCAVDMAELATTAIIQHVVEDRRADVRAFFEMAGQAMPERPCVPDEATVRLRLRLVVEEFAELMESALGKPHPGDHDAWTAWNHLGSLLDYADKGPVAVHLPDLADACIDLMYVTDGLLVAFGIDSRPLWAMVHEANLKKRGGPRRDDGKIGKAPGWTPPPIELELRRQGWELP